MYILFDSVSKQTASKHRTYKTAIREQNKVLEAFRRWGSKGIDYNIEVFREGPDGLIQRVSSEEQERLNILYGKVESQ